MSGPDKGANDFIDSDEVNVDRQTLITLFYL